MGISFPKCRIPLGWCLGKRNSCWCHIMKFPLVFRCHSLRFPWVVPKRNSHGCRTAYEKFVCNTGIPWCCCTSSSSNALSLTVKLRWYATKQNYDHYKPSNMMKFQAHDGLEVKWLALKCGRKWSWGDGRHLSFLMLSTVRCTPTSVENRQDRQKVI